MNKSMIAFVLGWIMKIEAVLMVLPFVTALLYQESSAWVFPAVFVPEFILGQLMTMRKPRDPVFYIKEGCIATALGWIVMSIVGCLPFVISGSIPSFTDALFETISGFTTTGASVLSEVESLPKGILFWRSFTHWIGGMGVLVFLMSVVQMTGGSTMNLMKAESPGPSVGKLVPKAKYTARWLYGLYIGLTLMEVLLLLAGGMNLFESLLSSFATAGTGGFGFLNDSMASFSGYLQWVMTIFMILFGVNFNAYYFIVRRKWKQVLEMEEVRNYLLIILAAIAIITWNAYDPDLGGFFVNLRHVSFQVASIITTTGFSTVNFDLWPETSRTIMVLLMFIGACAGSTGGGIKVSRITVLFKTIAKEMNSYIYPKSIRKVKMDGKPVEHEVLRSINVFFITFIIIFSTSVLLVSLEGKDLITNFTAVAATINNIGPGLALVGPTQNFGSFTAFSKYVLMFDMLAGRLELFPLLLLFYPPCWKSFFKHRNKK